MEISYDQHRKKLMSLIQKNKNKYLYWSNYSFRIVIAHFDLDQWRQK